MYHWRQVDYARVLDSPIFVPSLRARDDNRNKDCTGGKAYFGK